MKKAVCKGRLNNDKADSETLVGSRGMWDEPGEVVKGHNLQCPVGIIYKSELYPKSKGKQEKDIRTQYLCMYKCLYKWSELQYLMEISYKLKNIAKKILLESTIILRFYP